MQNDFVYHIPYSVLFADEKALSCRSKLIFAYVSSLAHKGGECFATNEHIASKFKYSVRDIQRCLKQLANANLIEIENNYKYKSQRVITIKNSTRGDESVTQGWQDRHGGTTEPAPQGDKIVAQGRQDCHARVTSSSYRGDRTDTHINNININNNTYSNNSKSPNTLSKPFEYPKDEEIQKRIEKRLNYIQEFKANNKTFNCECCNHEIDSESVNDETGIYHCDNCNYGIRIPIPKF